MLFTIFLFREEDCIITNCQVKYQLTDILSNLRMLKWIQLQKYNIYGKMKNGNNVCDVDEIGKVSNKTENIQIYKNDATNIDID